MSIEIEDTLLSLVMQRRGGTDGEPLDGDEVDDLCHFIKQAINLHEGNISEKE